MYFSRIQCIICVCIHYGAFSKFTSHQTSLFHFLIGTILGAQKGNVFGFVSKNKNIKACSVLLPPVCGGSYKGIVDMLVSTGPKDLQVDLFLELLLVII